MFVQTYINIRYDYKYFIRFVETLIKTVEQITVDQHCNNQTCDVRRMAHHAIKPHLIGEAFLFHIFTEWITCLSLDYLESIEIEHYLRKR